MQTLYSFPAPPLGGPGAVVLGNDGNFYGTTLGVGEGNGSGIAFRITPEGIASILYQFSQPDGFLPGDLVQGSDGDFYGTAIKGGASALTEWPGYGTIFKITPAGVLTVLYSFSNRFAGACAAGGVTLVEGPDGDFYGPGVCVFKITPDGVLTTVHTFTQAEGSGSGTALTLGNDGNFYGRTAGGPGAGPSVLFKMTPAGALTVLYAFPGVPAAQAPAEPPLIQASDGNFYGTTSAGGTNYAGSLFRLTPQGAFTSVYSFARTAGSGPDVALVQGSDGRLYGATSRTLFAITLDGAFTTLYSFPGDVGPTSLVETSDGSFYATTGGGGANDGGTFFKMTLSSDRQGAGGGAIDGGLLALLGVLLVTRLAGQTRRTMNGVH